MRPLTPRLQTTTLPVAVPGASVDWQSASSPGRLAAMTTGVARRDAVGERDARDCRASRRRRRSGAACEVNERGPVEAPTVVTHGPPWSEVPAPGPELPAEALTEIPALNASRKASSTGSVYGEPPPEIEKLITLTPSVIACWTADTESEPKQPCTRQTRNVSMCAPGAMPQTGPRSTPYSTAEATQSPPAVVVVCVPWPSESRGEQTSRRVVAELLAVRADDRHVGRGLGVRADQLVVARERRTEMRDVGAVTELAALEAAGGCGDAGGRHHRVLGPDARVDHRR